MNTKSCTTITKITQETFLAPEKLKTKTVHKIPFMYGNG